MKLYIKLVTYFVAILSSGAGFSQSIVAASNSPVAFVYVSNSPSGDGYEIDGFAASPNGRLAPITGSPFAGDVQNMAVNGKYLFGTNGVYIYSFSIASNGALEQVSSVNAQQFNGADCGGPNALFLDHTGATLYDEDIYGNNCANNAYQSFSISGSTGDLNYLGMTGAASPAFNVPLGFIGNNVFAYGATCYHFNPSIFGFQRSADGTLDSLNMNPPMPAAKSGDFYCPYLAAADPINHLAISVQSLTGNWTTDGPPQLATYTADDSGNLTTNSDFSNMPATSVQDVTDIWMSPSGELLAVAGVAGLQIFHFNGSNPITPYTGRLTRDEVDQLFWDNDNHLYAISRSADKLFVFTITPTTVSEATGSPYTITNPQNIIVLPKD